MLTDVLWGLRATVRDYRLVLLIWAGYAGLAAVAVAPALNWWRRAFDHSIEATTLLRGFNFAVLGDLTKYDYVGAFGLLNSTIAGVALLAIAASSFMMGGMLKVISGTDTSRGLMHRFFGGGGCFFWRFFRLLLVGGACAVIVVAGLMAALAAIESPFLENASEAGSYLWLLFNLPIVAIACGLFLLALDYARLQVVIDDSRGMARTYFRALLFVLRHPVTTYGMAILILILAAMLMLGYVAYETMSPVAASWGAIALLFGIQQAIALTRVGLRVSLVHAEFRYAVRLGSPHDVGADPVIAAPMAPDADEPVPESMGSPPEARADSNAGDSSSIDSSSVSKSAR
jgi:hypothetical protein